MFTYKLDKVKKMGEMDPKYGQTYWCESSSELKPLKFNSMNGDITEGVTINAEESMNKRSAAGNDYLQLRKVTIADGSTPAPVKLADGVVSTQLGRIEQKLDQILKAMGEDTVHEVKEEPIDLNDIPDFG